MYITVKQTRKAKSNTHTWTINKVEDDLTWSQDLASLS